METVRNVAAQRSWLVFRIGPCVLCASVFDVEGIIPRPEGVAKFPLMPDYALGAFLFRGRSAAAISLRRRLRLKQGEDSATGPFIVAQVGEALVAFWVDEVKDVIGEQDAGWHPVPETLERGVFERLAEREGELILQTSFAALLKAAIDFETLGAWASREAAARNPVPLEPPSPAAVEPRMEAPTRIADDVPEPAAPAVPPMTERPAPRVDKTVRARSDIRRKTQPCKRPVRSPAAAMPLTVAPVSRLAPRTVARPEVAEPQRKSSASGYWLAAAAVFVVAATGATIFSGFSSAPAHDPIPLADRVIAPAAAEPAERPVALAPLAVQAPLPIAAPAAPVEREVKLTIHRPGEAVAPGGRVHVVVRGDTLWGIAKVELGDPYQYPELAKYSDIRNPHLIHPGDRIRIEIRQRAEKR